MTDDGKALRHFFAGWRNAPSQDERETRRRRAAHAACESGDYTVVMLRNGGTEAPIAGLAAANIGPSGVVRIHVLLYPRMSVPDDVLNALREQFAALANLPLAQTGIAFMARIMPGPKYTRL
jgi:hypothetical protein